MTPNHDRLRIEWLASQYLEAVENDDFYKQQQFWQLAVNDPALRDALIDVDADLFEEQIDDKGALIYKIAGAVEEYLPSAEIAEHSTGPVTAATVVNELIRQRSPLQPALAVQMQEALQKSAEPLPEDLGLEPLIRWAESRFGVAPVEYWKAFRQAALKVRMRTNAEKQFQLAARRTRPRTEDKS